MPTTYFSICKSSATTVYAVTLHCAQSGAVSSAPLLVSVATGGAL
jgi:hypothetical protein